MAEHRDEGFAARWSRRKRAARQADRDAAPEPAESPAPAPEAVAPQTALPAAGPEAGRAPALPDPATLDASSDFSAFLRQDVPIDVHRQALRRLWRLDPIYNRLDGLDDYCEDYTDQAMVVKGMRTAYQVGRGFLKQAVEAAPPAAEDPVAPSAAEDREAARLAAAPDDHTLATPPEPPAPSPGAAAPATAPRPRPRPLPKRG